VRRCGASRGLLTQKNLHARDARTHPTLNVCTVSLARTQNGAQKCAKVVRYAARSGARDRSFSLPSLLFFFCEAPVSTPCHETTSSFRLGSLSLSLSLSRSRPLRGARTNALRLCESQTSACDISRSCNRILPLCILATNKNAERRRARASAAIPGAHDNGDDRRQRLLNIDQSFARRRRSELREKGRMVASLNREAIAS